MANKKITELPYITGISGSTIADNPTQNEVVPVVMHGTTNQITVENFSKFMNAYTATTGSAGNTFVGPQIINNTVTINGNEIVNGNVSISGRLTVTEVVAQYETASILFSTGSTKLGDQITDKHEFTGSTNITGSLIVNGANLTDFSASNSTLFTNFSSSNSSRITALSSSNSSYNTTFSSSNATHITALSSSNSSYNTTFSSSNSSYNTTFSSSNSSYNTTFSSSNSSYNTTFSSSNSERITNLSASIDTTINSLISGTNSELARIYQTTQSLHVATASLNAFTASQDGRNFIISQYTSSTDAHIVGISAFTSSQLAVNLGNAIYTASVDSHIVGISTYTSSVRDTLARVHQATQSLQVATASIQIQTASLLAFTASQDSRNFTLSQVTGSLIGITNGLMAFTAALDNTYATDAQLYQLYQATRSIELTTGSLIGITNGLMAFTAALDSTYATDAQLYQLYQATRSIELTTGSLIGITNGLMAYTSSNETWKDGIRGEISGIEAWTASLDNTYATDAQLLPILQATRSLELLSGSLIGITNGLMAFTAALDSTYATDAQLYQLYQATQSLELHSGSMVGITNGLMALTASMKGQAIVSSSQQITNYYKFAQTSSANIFYNYQAISGSKLELHTSDANGGLVINSKATATQTFITLLDRGTNDNSVVATFEDTNGSNQLGGLKIEAGRKDNQAGIILKGKNKVANSGAVNGYITSVIGNAYSDNALTTLTTGVTGKSISFLGQDTELANLNFNGDLTITNGNLVVASGKGIDFSATSDGSGTTSSELLNDYEEGTWSPTVRGSGTAGTYELATDYTTYTKIGRQVTLNGQIKLGTSVTGGGTGYLQILGAPFTKAANTVAAGAVVLSGINFTGDFVCMAFASLGATTTIFLPETVDNASTTDLPISAAVANAQIQFTITYFV